MDVRASLAVFIHIDAQDALMECVNAGDGNRGSKPQRDFAEQQHGGVSSIRNVLVVQPNTHSVVVVLDGHQFRVALIA